MLSSVSHQRWIVIENPLSLPRIAAQCSFRTEIFSSIDWGPKMIAFIYTHSRFSADIFLLEERPLSGTRFLNRAGSQIIGMIDQIFTIQIKSCLMHFSVIQENGQVEFFLLFLYTHLRLFYSILH